MEERFISLPSSSLSLALAGSLLSLLLTQRVPDDRWGGSSLLCLRCQSPGGLCRASQAPTTPPRHATPRHAPTVLDFPALPQWPWRPGPLAPWPSTRPEPRLAQARSISLRDLAVHRTPYSTSGRPSGPHLATPRPFRGPLGRIREYDRLPPDDHLLLGHASPRPAWPRHAEGWREPFITGPGGRGLGGRSWTAYLPLFLLSYRGIRRSCLSRVGDDVDEAEDPPPPLLPCERACAEEVGVKASPPN